ncbi:MAG: NUDIX domain-containing protein [Salinibacterium sp.]|nr:MAG: NUDIX domain-containing protein [Salinibacterium sp.]
MSELRDELVELPVLSTETVFTGMVWNIDRERFRLGDTNGDETDAEITREFMAHTGAVAVLALDERERVLLIKQYRHPVRAREWELPAGLLDEQGESPLRTAKRELAEEADLVAEDWALLSEFASSPGGSNEVIRIYLARGISAANEVYERTDEEAEIELRWVPLDEAVNAVLAHDVQNSILMIGLLSAHAGRASGWQNLGDGDTPWPRHPAERSAR